jgi:hypothetical protein
MLNPMTTRIFYTSFELYPIALNSDVNPLATTLYANLKATAFATSAPFYTAMLGAHGGRLSSVQQLIKLAVTDPSAIKSAVHVLNDSSAFITGSLETLRTVHQRSLMPDAFQSLLRQATVMVWGTFEAFCFDLVRLLFTSDLKFLRQIVAAQGAKTPWSGTPKKLLGWIETKRLDNPALSIRDAFDTFDDIPSMNLRATRHLFGVLCASDTALATVLASSELTRLSCRRHLLVHAVGIVDRDYVSNSGEPLPIGSTLSVSPHDLALAFRIVSRAGAKLAQTASALL